MSFFITTQKASLQTVTKFVLINIYGASNVVVSIFSLMIPTFAIWSSVIRPVLKRACPSEEIRSHVFMIRAINISLNASMYDGCLTVCGTCGAGIHTHIPSQRARASSGGKTPSFGFSQVDMYGLYKV